MSGVLIILLLRAVKLVEPFDSYTTLKASAYLFCIILEALQAADGAFMHYFLSAYNLYLGISTYLAIANVGPGYLNMFA